MRLPNDNIPPAPSHRQAMMRPMKDKNKNIIASLRSLSMGSVPFCTHSGMKRAKNKPMKSVPTILAVHRITFAERANGGVTSFTLYLQFALVF